MTTTNSLLSNGHTKDPTLTFITNLKTFTFTKTKTGVERV